MAEDIETQGTPEPIEYPVIIKLRQPIQDEEGNPLSELVIKKPPTGAAFLQFPMEKQTTLDFLQAASKMTNVPLPILKRMCVQDTMKVVGKVADFFE